jgi:hypothetical protein
VNAGLAFGKRHLWSYERPILIIDITDLLLEIGNFAKKSLDGFGHLWTSLELPSSSSSKMIQTSSDHFAWQHLLVRLHHSVGCDQHLTCVTCKRGSSWRFLDQHTYMYLSLSLYIYISINIISSSLKHVHCWAQQNLWTLSPLCTAQWSILHLPEIDLYHGRAAFLLRVSNALRALCFMTMGPLPHSGLKFSKVWACPLYWNIFQPPLFSSISTTVFLLPPDWSHCEVPPFVSLCSRCQH